MRKAIFAATTFPLLLTVACVDLKPAPPKVARSTIWVAEAKRGDLLLRLGGDGVLISDRTAELDIPPQQSIRDVQVGQPADVNFAGIKIAGKVLRIDSPKPSGTISVTPVIVALDGAFQDAHAGSAIEGRIDAVTLKDVIYIPAPVLAPAQTQIYRLNSDQTAADPVKVEYGRLGADNVEIRSGLNPGDRVIVSSTAVYEASGKIAITGP
jgi:HlyD family secretion protein